MKAERKDLLNWLSLTGVLAVIFYFLHIYFGKKYYPDYDWMRQAVSDLTAVNSPSFIAASGYSSVYASLSCLCCVMVTILVRNRGHRLFRLGIYLYTAMNWISNIGYTLFPLSDKGFNGTFQDIMHFYVVTISVVLLSIVSLLLIIIGALKEKQKALPVIAILCLVSMFFGSIGTNIFSENCFGLMERFSVFSVVIFTGVLGVYGYAIKPAQGGS